MTINDMFRLDGTVAIVTGASSGLGVACALALADAGADVAIAARRTAELDATARRVAETGRRVLAVPTDVGDPAACRRLVEQTAAELGRVDVLVNNAGVGTAVPALREAPDEFRAVIDVNLNGCYWMAQEAARVMTDGGSIVNISSVLALSTGGLPQAAYTASKAGLLGLTRDLAQQWSGRRRIRVNAVCPGFFATEMTEHYPEGYLERMMADRVLLGRLGHVDELAAAVVFLASAAAGYITGATMTVDGGVSIT